jgi:hypothetical protein
MAGEGLNVVISGDSAYVPTFPTNDHMRNSHLGGAAWPPGAS